MMMSVGSFAQNQVDSISNAKAFKYYAYAKKQLAEGNSYIAQEYAEKSRETLRGTNVHVQSLLVEVYANKISIFGKDQAQKELKILVDIENNPERVAFLNENIGEVPSIEELENSIYSRNIKKMIVLILLNIMMGVILVMLFTGKKR